MIISYRQVLESQDLTVPSNSPVKPTHTPTHSPNLLLNLSSSFRIESPEQSDMETKLIIPNSMDAIEKQIELHEVVAPANASTRLEAMYNAILGLGIMMVFWS